MESRLRSGVCQNSRVEDKDVPIILTGDLLTQPIGEVSIGVVNKCVNDEIKLKVFLKVGNSYH